MITKEKKVVTRFAPSPTGFLHIGGSRTALFNYLVAKREKGKFILRIEDTDKERSKKEYEDDIIETLNWMGVKADETYRQSERGEIYKKYLDQMVKDGTAYISAEEDTTDGKRGSVIRCKNPNKEITFDDEILGEVKFETSELGDFVIAKDFDTPLYHFAVVVDDYEMGISHIIRGQEHISNTPRQIIIQEALQFSRPKYAHIPLILAPDKSKLSKRHGAISTLEYKKEGYLPSALVNFLALLGWSPQSISKENDREIYSLDELVDIFDLKKVQKAGAVFNEQKLLWLNKEYIKKMNSEEADIYIKEYTNWYDRDPSIAKKISTIAMERISKLVELSDLDKKGGFEFFFSEPKYDRKLLLGKKGELDQEKVKRHLIKMLDLKLEHDTVWQYAEEEGKGEVLWPLRVALSGQERSPDPFQIIETIGKEESLKRVDNAISIL